MAAGLGGSPGNMLARRMCATYVRQMAVGSDLLQGVLQIHLCFQKISHAWRMSGDNWSTLRIFGRIPAHSDVFSHVYFVRAWKRMGTPGVHMIPVLLTTVHTLCFRNNQVLD